MLYRRQQLLFRYRTQNQAVSRPQHFVMLNMLSGGVTTGHELLDLMFTFRKFRLLSSEVRRVQSVS